jgi:hypothetical protein
VDRPKRRQRRLPLTGMADAREIGVEIEGFRHGSVAVPSRQ